MESVVELAGVSKAFIIKRNPALNLKVRAIGLIHARHRERREEFWALREIDMNVRRGSFIGLIGPNGSGKSTLLRIIAGIFPPTRGEVTVRGRVAPMIELGVGFHPDLTGRENIYLNTSLFRLSRRETDAIVGDVVAFAELEDFIDLPIKNYSSGMYMRLGFAVAVHLDPEVLLIDEVLAVGDARFTERCLKRMDEIRRKGRTIILVSHSLELVRRLCDRACLLVHGRIRADGDPAQVIARYREITAEMNGESRAPSIDPEVSQVC
jgi:ABC-type polysaccharide/polyol phosphate transport system ATPase subunit